MADNIYFSTAYLYTLVIEDGKGKSARFLATLIRLDFTFPLKTISSSLVKFNLAPYPLIRSVSGSNL